MESMKPKRIKLYAIVMAFALIALSACSNNNSGGPPAETSSPADQTAPLASSEPAPEDVEVKAITGIFMTDDMGYVEFREGGHVVFEDGVVGSYTQNGNVISVVATIQGTNRLFDFVFSDDMQSFSHDGEVYALLDNPIRTLTANFSRMWDGEETVLAFDGDRISSSVIAGPVRMAWIRNSEFIIRGDRLSIRHGEMGVPQHFLITDDGNTLIQFDANGNANRDVRSTYTRVN